MVDSFQGSFMLLLFYIPTSVPEIQKKKKIKNCCNYRQLASFALEAPELSKVMFHLKHGTSSAARGA
jgi:hypothetical protein